MANAEMANPNRALSTARSELGDGPIMKSVLAVLIPTPPNSKFAALFAPRTLWISSLPGDTHILSLPEIGHEHELPAA